MNSSGWKTGGADTCALDRLYAYTNDGLSGTMPSSICDLVAGKLDDCELQQVPFACPLPACGGACKAACK